MHKQNRSISASNRRRIREGKPHLVKDKATINQAPSNLLERNTIFPEAVVYRIFRKEVRFQVETGVKKAPALPASTSTASASSPKKASNKARTPPKGWQDTSLICLSSDDDDEENEVSTRFKNRFSQRRAISEMNRKNYTTVTKAAKVKASAFHAHASASILKSKADLLKTAAQCNLPNHILHKYLQGMLDETFEVEQAQKKPAAKKRKEDQVADLVKREEEMTLQRRKRDYAMWDIYEKQREQFELYQRLYAAKPKNDKYSTPPPTFSQYLERNATEIIDQMPDPVPLSDSTQSSSPHKGQTLPRDPLKAHWKCCAGDGICKHKTPAGSATAVSCTIMCAFCKGFAHYECVTFQHESRVGEPVCIPCDKYYGKKEPAAEDKTTGTCKG